MIVNVPNSQDLQTISLQLYFNAWVDAVKVVTEFYDVFNAGGDANEAWAEYVKAAQGDLQRTYTLIQQSQEIGIKALIAEVSPFLLLKRQDARPSPASAGAYDFTDFPTIDASELVRVHDTFCARALSGTFAGSFDRLRRERNKIAHLGMFTRELSPYDLINLLFQQYIELYPNRRWLQDRIEFASKHRWASLINNDDWSPTGEVLLELWGMNELLTGAQHQLIFGHSKKKRASVCPDCGPLLERHMDGNEPYGGDMPTAYADGSSLQCAACAKTFVLRRKVCADTECGGSSAATGSNGAERCTKCGYTEQQAERGY